jgi:uncharacterized membrane protein YphA (DoxX/SURF4 family)
MRRWVREQMFLELPHGKTWRPWISCIHVTHTILTICKASSIMIYQLLISGKFTKLKRGTLSFIMAVCLFVCPHGTILLALDGLSWNFEAFFKNLSRKIKFFWNLTRITGTLREDRRTFISRWIILRMRNSSDKIRTENQNTHFMFHNSFPQIVPFMR